MGSRPTSEPADAASLSSNSSSSPPSPPTKAVTPPSTISTPPNSSPHPPTTSSASSRRKFDRLHLPNTRPDWYNVGRLKDTICDLVNKVKRRSRRPEKALDTWQPATVKRTSHHVLLYLYHVLGRGAGQLLFQRLSPTSK